MNQFIDFFQHFGWDRLITFVLQAVAVLLCLMVHEVSHGLAAYVLGDPTAKMNHRLSLNPLRHLDPFGTLMMLFVGFGWAKPVPVDMRYFKHPKQGMAITALAGPVSNFILAYIALVAANFTAPFASQTGGWQLQLVNFFLSLTLLSLGLGVFNLIPFPPLDGSKVVEGFLPDKIAYTILRYERYGMFLLMAILWFGLLDGPLAVARGAVFDLFQKGAVWAQYLAMGMI